MYLRIKHICMIIEHFVYSLLRNVKLSIQCTMMGLDKIQEELV